MRGREQKETFQAIVSEVDNLRIAWLCTIERGYMEVADKFIGAFSVLATVRGWFHEMIRLFDKAIARPGPLRVDDPIHRRLHDRQRLVRSIAHDGGRFIKRMPERAPALARKD
jgi:hypothetical protein